MISVIIPTYNEKKVLENCIESLGAQTLDNFEIIVIDDGSTDGTYEILTNLKRTLNNFTFYEQKHMGAGAARNLGAKKATGNILVFVDADMTFDKDFLKRLIEPIVSGRSKGTFSKDEYVANWQNVWARAWNINEGWEEERRHPENYPDTQHVFRAVLASEFERVGGFTPGGYNDDWTLSQKLGYEATAAQDAIFYHKNPATLSEAFKHAKWVAKRKYKLGFLGYIVALLRFSLPMSIVIGVVKSLYFKAPFFIIFKTVYDFGAFLGILEFMFLGRGGK